MVVKIKMYDSKFCKLQLKLFKTQRVSNDQFQNEKYIFNEYSRVPIHKGIVHNR